MKGKTRLALVAVVLLEMAARAEYPIVGCEFGKARVTEGFWFDRLETNRTATLRSNLAKCNETPRIANFTNAANRAWGRFGGIPFDDSDVFKVMEGAAYILATHPDPELEKYMDWLIGEIARAQETDGYLYTARTLGFAYAQKGDLPWQFGMMGPTRWSNCGASHELYNVGHMYEAAVAWHRVTGKTNFLDVAVKNANLVCRTFGWDDDQLKDAPGHEEIELALCKLYQETGMRKYLDQAKFFLDMRGRKDLRKNAGSADRQDHRPVVEQDEAIGHAVRAGYLYTGMADVAALTGDGSYIAAIDRLWENVVSKKLYLTGGIGARREFHHPTYGRLWEAFNGPYDLPNDADEAYLETCAAIANILWNQRMFLWHGESKYVDVAELALHNGFLAGISLSGDEYFYPNPLASKGGYKRSKWFGCSCCPVNDVRFIPQVPSMAYATDGKGTLYWNLFMSGTAKVGGWEFEVKTDYPWSGQMKMTLLSAPSPSPSTSTSLRLRVPGWAKGRPVPSDLYVQTAPSSAMEVSVAVNGRAVNGVPGKDGYLTVEREWRTDDTVEVNFPMPVKRIRAHEQVAADRGRLAVMRGPILYCAEGVDNGGKAYGAALPADATFVDETLTIGDKAFPALRASNGLRLIPYCLWGNREPGNELQCWFRE